MHKEFNLLKLTRENILKVTEGLTDDQLLKIPAGFNNNILWHMGHVFTSTQRLTYVLSGLPMTIQEEYVGWFVKGTGPQKWSSTPDFKQVRELLLSTATQLKEDYDKGVFKHYKEYQTSYGFLIKDIDSAILFSLFHEAVHLGNIESMKKLL